MPTRDGRHAFVLGNLWEDVYGFELETCKLVFSARQSEGDVTVKTVQSLAVSADGSELYTVQNPVRRGADRFEVLPPRLAVYRIADGLDAKPVRSFPVKRRITKIAATAGANGAAITPGLTTLADLAAYQPKKRPAVCTSYRAYMVCGMGPPSSGGITVAQSLGILENFDLAQLRPTALDGEGGNRITWVNAANPYCSGDVTD